jgi:protein-S-isoprenylcysteine O-methyltransferase Ste14
LAVKYTEYVVLALVWTSWCVAHSALVSTTVTDYLKSKLGVHFRFYRIFYNGFAIVTLIPVAIYSYAVQGEPVFVWDGYLRIFQAFLFLIAIYLFFAGMTHYDAFQFLGIRQMKQRSVSDGMTKTGELNATGILGTIRHPWYVGAIAFIWARQLDVSAIIVNIILTSHLIIGTFLEERKLVAEFGDEYRAYQKEVPMFIPFKWLKSKMGL